MKPKHPVVKRVQKATRGKWVESQKYKHGHLLQPDTSKLSNVEKLKLHRPGGTLTRRETAFTLRALRANPAYRILLKSQIRKGKSNK